MTDIIQDAKRLFENRYHKEPWLEMIGDPMQGCWISTDNYAEVSGDFVSPHDVRLAAAAPEFAQALAVETYEYTAQVFMNQHWVFMWSPRTGNSVDGKWHPTRTLAEKFADQWQLDYPVRMVRRRVSPTEVIE